MADQWDERQRSRAEEEFTEWRTEPGRNSPDDPEFRTYRPNFPGGEHYRGPRRGFDPRIQSADDPEFRNYEPVFNEGDRDRRRDEWGPGEYQGHDYPPRTVEDDEWRRPGRFTGYGPRGYQRSDERIREDVCERLTYYGELDAREIDIEVEDGEVTLTGMVEDRQAKRAAERIAETVSGVHDVHNQLGLRTHIYNRMR